ncbi:hypothetical protein NUU61_005567 [Penicillium alfredii]|uniref:Uncharacterized protein n=1 Tax=Penicillium alfredii TaxID=1506179 RepID=A0A9W9K8B2_9EURO|nr:uncharacterized protein NUU61_005567 [Penicillium alfredii]KAJ5096211.1 hypothetical protein NUU61_005567 [Penicillium alfredii]
MDGTKCPSPVYSSHLLAANGALRTAMDSSATTVTGIKWDAGRASPDWFALENPCLLVGFLSAIRSQVRSWIRRISFMPLHDRIWYIDNDEFALSHWQREGNDEPTWSGWKDMG